MEHVPLIIKADVAGSLEAMEGLIEKISQEHITLDVVRNSVGDINESDIKLGRSLGRVIIVGFKVRTDTTARELLRQTPLPIVTGEIIYDIVDEVRRQIGARIRPTIERTEIGTIKILKIFKSKDRSEQVIGGRVEDGVMRSNTRIEIRRNREPIGTGTIKRLQRGKEQVDEVARGSEFGALVSADITLEEGDVCAIAAEQQIQHTL